MEQAKKHLKWTSIALLALAGSTLLQIVAELLFGDLNNAEIPAGSPDHILMITKIILLGFSCVMLFPQVYVGVKGLLVVKAPNASKGHIIWAIILFVFTLVDLLSPAFALVMQDNVNENLSLLLGGLVEASVYFDYIKYAKVIAREC